MVLMEAPVIMGSTDPADVERRVSAGELVCPCGGDLARWGCPAEDGRGSRCWGRAVRCVACPVTHVLSSIARPWINGLRSDTWDAGEVRVQPGRAPVCHV